jgi:hypothetical protein
MHFVTLFLSVPKSQWWKGDYVRYMNKKENVVAYFKLLSQLSS